MEYRTEELAKEFLEEFYRLGRMAQSRTISHSMKGRSIYASVPAAERRRCHTR